MRLESEIEQRAIKRLYAKLGCLQLKTSEPLRHYPDRLVLMRGGRLAWIEFKQPGKSQTPAQKYVASELRTLGFDVYTVTNENEYVELLSNLNAEETDDK